LVMKDLPLTREAPVPGARAMRISGKKKLR
jgi:hypothetical protein